LGVLGLSLVDLEMLTPVEFEAVSDAHQQQSDAHLRDEWTRARLVATISVQPHTTRKITPEQLLPLPWDNAPRHRPAADTPKMTTAEQRARAHELAARLAKKQ
jgi:hypothetical protein